MINILIVDDHPIIRKGLTHLISEEKDMRVVCATDSAYKMFEFLSKNKTDLIVLDISLPGMSGVEALGTLQRDYSDIPVLVLSGMPEEEFGMRILKAGASGFLHKESATDELITAIRRIYAGKHYLSQKLADLLADFFEAKQVSQPHQLLSNREFEVFCKIGSGKPIGQIADEMCLSVKTISTYRGRILSKMKLANNAEIVHYCVRTGLVQ